jgi:hypothetical protein
MKLERADVQGQVENVDEGRKRHAVDAVSGWVCKCMCVLCVCMTPGQGDRTRLAVGAVDGTAGYPRTAKSLQFGGRFDSERGALARIHIPQLSERLCGAGLVLARSSRECGGLGTSLGRATQQAVWRGLWALSSCCQWRRAVCGSIFYFAWVRGGVCGQRTWWRDQYLKPTAVRS